MDDALHCERTSTRIAMVIPTETIGGHEFQSRALAEDLAKLCRLTIHLNREEHRPMFASVDADVEVHPGLFLSKGWLGKQALRGLLRRKQIRHVLEDYDHVIVCGGTVEAGVCTSVALAGSGKAILYLPSFYDRTVQWGKPLGCSYNLVLGCFGMAYSRIVTINRIQARLIKGFLHRPVLVVPNHLRQLPRATSDVPGRVLCVSRLDAQKRISELLRWLDFAENPFQEVLVIGEGPARSEIESTSASLKYIRVTMLGWKSPAEQDELIGRNDVLVLNSRMEGEPLVIREANMRGISVLARDIVGVRGVTKRSSRFKNELQLRQALLRLSSMPPVNVTSRTNRHDLVCRMFKSITERTLPRKGSGQPA